MVVVVFLSSMEWMMCHERLSKTHQKKERKKEEYEERELPLS